MVDASGAGSSPGEVCLTREPAFFCNTVVDGEVPRDVIDPCYVFMGSPVTQWADGDCDGDTTSNGDEGSCPCAMCGAPIDRDGGSARVDGGSVTAPAVAGFTFRGAGGCVCDAVGSRRADAASLLALLLPLALTHRFRRRWRR